MRTQLDAKLAEATCTAIFPFGGRLQVGETISSASVAATVYSGTDLTPSDVISGAAAISGEQVSQLLVDGVAGVTYDLVATAITSLGQTLKCAGFLTVIS